MKIMIIDGNSIVNRAYYGVRPLTNAEGLNTNAVYGFLSIYFKILEDVSPDGVCVAFDLRKPTFRHLKYEGYKAKRKGMPEELAEQMQPLKDVLDAMNITRFECEGYEADDIIGTVSRRCAESGNECVIVTGDRDSFQLIENDGTDVLLVSSKMGRTETTLYNGAELFVKYGLPPELLRDLKALMGDASDNIPGVPGIGEKTALELVSRFGDIDSLYENIDSADIKDSVRKKLVAGKESAYLSKWLGTIAQDVPIEFECDGVKIREYNNDELYKLFARLEFKSFITRLKLTPPSVSDIISEAEKEELEKFVLSTAESVESAKEKLSGKRVALVFAGGMEAVSAAADGVVYSMARANCDEALFGDFIAFLMSDKTEKIVHDKKQLRADIRGEEICGKKIEVCNVVFDLALCAYVLDSTRKRYDLPSIAHLFGYEIDAPFEKLGDGASFSPLTGCEDGLRAIACVSEAMFNIAAEMKKRLAETGAEALFYDIEQPFTDVLCEMEAEGVTIDAEELSRYSEFLSEQLALLEKAIHSAAGEEFNIQSPKQLGEILFEKLGIPPVKKSKRGYSTDAEVLAKLKNKHEVVPLILEYRRFAKLKSTYAEGLLRCIDRSDGKIHTTFQQMVTATGRISSTEPNLQNIPIRSELGGEVRRMFVPSRDDTCFVDADYSQIELRVLAHITGDKAMCDAFKNGEDIHSQTASQVFGVSASEVTPEMRRVAKAVNFGIVYGISEFSLAEDIGVSRAEAKRYMEAYLSHYCGVRDYMKSIVEKAKADGFVTTMFGRRRYIPELASTNYNLRSFGERVALNAPIQGSAADIIKLAMIRVAKRLRDEKMPARLILQVHDELIIEAKKNVAEEVARLLTEEMQNVCEMAVPLIAEAGIGDTWYDAKK